MENFFLNPSFSICDIRIQKQIRAYEAVSSHHALRARDIIYFGNRFELGTIKTPKMTQPVESFFACAKLTLRKIAGCAMVFYMMVVRIKNLNLFCISRQ